MDGTKIDGKRMIEEMRQVRSQTFAGACDDLGQALDNFPPVIMLHRMLGWICRKLDK